MVKLFCAIVGVAGSAFPVDVDAGQTVGDLKKAVKEEKPNKLKDVDADELQLSLAKKGTGWLPSADLRAIRKGEDVPGFERVSLVDTEDEAYSTYSIRDVLDTNGMPPPQTRQIHVLVVVSDGSNVAKDSPLPSAITHSENRRKRWRELNEILDKNKKAKTNGVDGSSNGYSYVRWSDVKSTNGINRSASRFPIMLSTF
ncbi:unnamed protein product [Phytophthora lilii]|uniref:Unnamed protein product n=1 Tax=Phytophthora lilii TaxID=2077276 RepID=A0A9W6XRE7_9STRA|nr:unnamed protein product [Phytophthora lilii]